MALKKTYEFALDLKDENSLSLPNVVSGDTGNVFIIKILDSGAPVSLAGARVRLVITNRDGQGAQDSVLSESGIDTSLAESGVVSVSVFSSMVSNGLNTGCVEIYTTAEEEWDTLLTTNDFMFVATNAPSEKAVAYPSLVEAEQKFNELIDELKRYIDLFNPDNCVHYTEQSVSAEEQSIARTNVDAAAFSHDHGQITPDGRLNDRAGCIVETDSLGRIVAKRRIVVSNQDPTTMTDLSENDIILWDHT